MLHRDAHQSAISRNTPVGSLIILLLGITWAPAYCATEGKVARSWEVPEEAVLSITNRSNWKEKKDLGVSAFVVLENEYLMVLLKKGASSITISAKGAPDPCHETANMQFGASADKAGAVIKSIQLLCPGGDAAKATLEMDNGVQVLINLPSRRSFLKCTPSKKITVTCFADMKMAIRPDFFATDVILHPSLSTFTSGQGTVPLEHYIFGVMNDNTALGMAWASSTRRMALSTSGKGENSVFKSITVDFKNDHNELSLGFIKGAEAFKSFDLKDIPYDQEMKHKNTTLKLAVLEKPWKPPVSARWGVLMLHGERKPEETPFHPVSRNWLLQGVMGNKDGSVSYPLHKPGKLWQAAKWSWGFPTQRGAVFDGRQKLTLCLEERFSPYTCAVCYPMARWDDTPDDFVTVVDFVAEALGPKAMEEVFDLPGLKPRWTDADRQTTARASCGACAELNKFLAKTRPMTDEGRTKVREGGAQIASYLRMMGKRAAEYLEFAKAMNALCESEKNSGNALLAARIQEELSVLEKELEYENRMGGVDLDEKGIEGRVNPFLEDLVAWPEDINKRIRDHRGWLANRIGNAVDSFVSKANLIVQRIVQTTVLYSGQDEKGQVFARSVLARCHAVVQNRHHMEEHLVESAERDPLPNPARLKESKP